jgi:hypothetical protein
MIQHNGNDPKATAQLEEDLRSAPGSEESPASGTAQNAFPTREALRPRADLKQNKLVAIGGGAIAIVLALFIFASRPSQHLPRKESAGDGVHRQTTNPNPDEQKSLFPVTEPLAPPAKGSNDGLLGEQDVAQTATRRSQEDAGPSAPRVAHPGSLGAIPPFDSQTGWQAPAYQPASDTSPSLDRAKPARIEPSLVFVQKAIQKSSVSGPTTTIPDPAFSLGLPIGTRLRARLESAASTAVRTPVIAVVEYNYERDGEIIVPAGAKAFGRIEQADRSGYVSIRFDTLLMPDGSQASLDAVATNLGLGPLRGKVEGKNGAKRLLVRSLSGIGEVGALVAGGTGNISQPFSEQDFLRERVATNIGSSGDQALDRLAATEHIVVTIFADTPIYVVLDRNAKAAQADGTPQTGSGSPNSADSLRQLLQLQRELNQSALTTSH